MLISVSVLFSHPKADDSLHLEKPRQPLPTTFCLYITKGKPQPDLQSLATD